MTIGKFSACAATRAQAAYSTVAREKAEDAKETNRAFREMASARTETAAGTRREPEPSGAGRLLQAQA